jgi:phage-related holin
MEWAKTFGYMVSVFTFDYLNIPQEQLTILGVLMLLDTMTGVAKAYKTNPKTITSHALAVGVLKKFLTVILVYTLALVGKWVNIPPAHFMEWGLSILIMAEWYSAIQNIYAVRTGKVLPEYDVISIILKKLSDFLKEKLDNATNPWQKQ